MSLPKFPQYKHLTPHFCPCNYIFSLVFTCGAGKQFWVFKDTMLQRGYPKDITQFARGMPSQSFETAVWWEDVAKTYFFKGDRWVQWEQRFRLDPFLKI